MKFKKDFQKKIDKLAEGLNASFSLESDVTTFNKIGSRRPCKVQTNFILVARVYVNESDLELEE